MHRDDPLFSVIIPTFNRASTLAECLQSLVSQSFTGFDVIVGDDGSDDCTLEVITSFSDVLDLKTVSNVHSGGPAKPRNNAARHARGRFLVFIDSDDLACPDKLFEIALVISESWDVLYHPLRVTSTRRPRTFTKKLVGATKLGDDPYRQLLDFGNPIALSGAVIRGDVFWKLGGFEESRMFHAFEDFDLWLRAAHVGARFHHMPKILGKYRKSPNQLSRSWDTKTNLAALTERYAADLNLSDFKSAFWARYGLARNEIIEGGMKKSTQALLGFIKTKPPGRLLARLFLLWIIRGPSVHHRVERPT